MGAHNVGQHGLLLLYRPLAALWVMMMMIVYPRETPPTTMTARAQPPAAPRRRHSRPHHRRHGEHSPTARQPHTNGLRSAPLSQPCAARWPSRPLWSGHVSRSPLLLYGLGLLHRSLCGQRLSRIVLLRYGSWVWVARGGIPDTGGVLALTPIPEGVFAPILASPSPHTGGVLALALYRKGASPNPHTGGVLALAPILEGC